MDIPTNFLDSMQVMITKLVDIPQTFFKLKTLDAVGFDKPVWTGQSCPLHAACIVALLCLHGIDILTCNSVCLNIMLLLGNNNYLI